MFSGLVRQTAQALFVFVPMSDMSVSPTPDGVSQNAVALA